MYLRDILGVIVAMWQGFIDSLCGALVLFSIDKKVNERINKSSNADPRRKDSSVGHSPARVSKSQKESQVLRRTFQCCALNGGVCLFSIVAFEYVALPVMKVIVTYLLGQSTTILWLWSWAQAFLTIFFSTVWVLPVFLISKVINSLWFQDIADCAYRYRQGRRKQLPSFSKLIADVLFSILVQALFLVQGVVVSKLPLPPIGEIFAFVHMCLLYSLYAFEYKWFNMGWELHRRLEYIEYNWPYFIGFGLPLAIVTQLSNSYLISGCIFSIIFPVFIISGHEAEPVTDTCDFPIKFFSPVVTISNFIFNKTIGPARVR